MFPAYPRSFGRLLAIGFALVAIPPMVALVGSALSLDRIAERSERAVHAAANTTRLGRQLAETVTALQRSARQFLILHDAEMLDTYREHRERLHTLSEDFAQTVMGGEGRAALADVVSEESAVYESLSAPTRGAADVGGIVAHFAHLDALVETVVRDGDDTIDREAEALRSTAKQARRILYLQLAALLPLIVFLAVGFAVLIGRPVRALDAAIRRLGQGQLSEPVKVAGPEDLKDLGQRLEWMRGQLINVEREKNRFLREISHALKTPLAALREGTDLLSERALGGLTPEQGEIAQILRRNGIELQHLIEGLLDYGSAQFKRTALELSPVALQDLAQRVVEDHRFALQGKQIALEFSAPRMTVRADAYKVKEILDNLLSNAIKYSPEGGRISLALAREGAHIVIDIADQGPGIALEDRERIFDPFYQGRVPASGSIKGSGVGLSIVREYAVAHGGGVTLMDSAAGARFRVVIGAEPAA